MVVVLLLWSLSSLQLSLAEHDAGPMADYISPRAVFWLALPLAAQILIPTLSGALLEEKVPKGSRGLDWQKLGAQPRLFGMALAMAAAAVGMACVNMFGDRWMQSLYALGANPAPLHRGLSSLATAVMQGRARRCAP